MCVVDDSELTGASVGASVNASVGASVSGQQQPGGSRRCVVSGSERKLWHGRTKVRALVERSSDSAVKEIEEVAHDVSQSDVAARFDLGAVRQKKDQGQGQYQAGVVADLGPEKGHRRQAALADALVGCVG